MPKFSVQVIKKVYITGTMSGVEAPNDMEAEFSVRNRLHAGTLTDEDFKWGEPDSGMPEVDSDATYEED